MEGDAEVGSSPTVGAVQLICVGMQRTRAGPQPGCTYLHSTEQGWPELCGKHRAACRAPSGLLA